MQKTKQIFNFEVLIIFDNLFSRMIKFIKPNYLETFKEVYNLIENPEFWCFVEECHKKIFVLEDLPCLFEEIRSMDLRKQHLGVIGLRKLLEYRNQPLIQQISDGNIVPRLIEILKMDDFPYLKYEVAWILADLSGENTFHIQIIVDNGGITSLIKLLDSKFPVILEQVK